MRSLLLVALLASSATAAADVVDVPGVASVEVDAAPVPGCTLEAEGVCLVAWDNRGTPLPGDDTVYLQKAVDQVVVTSHLPVAVPMLIVEPSAVRVPNPGFPLAAQAWSTLNATAAPASGGMVTFDRRQAHINESREGLFVDAHPPVHVPLPLASDPFTTLDVGTCWDPCYIWQQYIYASTEDEVHLFPYNLFLWNTDTDGNIRFNIAGATECGPYEGDAVCAQERAAGQAGLAAYAVASTLTPDVWMGFSFNRTVLRSDAPRLEAARHAAFGASRDAAGAAERGASAGQGRPAPARVFAAPPRGAPTGPPLPPPPGETGRTVALGEQDVLPAPASLALLALASASLAALVLLYHRITRERALEQGTRRKVYDAIVAQPGVRIGTLAARLGLSYKTAQRHVHVLEREGMVRGHGDTQRHFFAATRGFSTDAMRQSTAMWRGTSRAVVEMLRRRGPMDLPALCAELGLAKSTVSTAVLHLARIGVVERRRRMRRIEVRLAVAAAGSSLPAGATA